MPPQARSNFQFTPGTTVTTWPWVLLFRAMSWHVAFPGVCLPGEGERQRPGCELPYKSIVHLGYYMASATQYERSLDSKASFKTLCDA